MQTKFATRPTKTAAETKCVFEEYLEKLPASITVTEETDSLTICEDWFNWGAVMVIVFVGLIAFTMVKAGPMFARLPDDEKLPIEVVGCLIAGLIVATYWAIANIANSTKLTATDKMLSRSIGPIPWPGSFQLPSRDIDQLFVIRKERSRGRNTPWDWDGDETTLRSGDFSLRKYKKVSYFKVVLKQKDGSRYTVSNEYRLPNTPKILEHLLEVRMRIANRFVAEELRT